MMMAILSSRFGLAGMALVAALGWHYVDKDAAVRSAESALADQVTIQTLTAARDAALQQAVTAKAAADRLAGEVMRAAETSAQLEQELEVYEQTTNVNPLGIVDRNVLGQLRNR